MFSINTLYKLCTSLIILKIIKEWYDNPLLYNDYIINILYKFIYLYSKCQIAYNTYFKEYILYMYIIMRNFTSNIYLQSQIEFYDNGYLISNKNINNLNLTNNEKIVLLLKSYEPIEYNYIIYSVYDSKTNKVNKKCFNYFPETFECDISNIKFISLLLLYKNLSFHIDLTNKIYNYYIIGNIINKKFLLYYIHNYIQDIGIFDYNDFVYKLELMDQNVNVIYLDENDEIIINKNDYTIKNKTSNIELELEPKTNYKIE